MKFSETGKDFLAQAIACITWLAGALTGILLFILITDGMNDGLIKAIVTAVIICVVGVLISLKYPRVLKALFSPDILWPW